MTSHGSASIRPRRRAGRDAAPPARGRAGRSTARLAARSRRSPRRSGSPARSPAALTIAVRRDRAGRARVASPPRRAAGLRSRSPGSRPARARRRASSSTTCARSLAVGGLLLIAQSAYWTGRTARPGRGSPDVQRLGEALLGAAVAANVIVVGASFGAYGTRMLRAALPHGPVELAAYSLALALYLQGRTRRAPGPTRARGRWRSASRCSRSPPCSRPS